MLHIARVFVACVLGVVLGLSGMTASAQTWNIGPLGSQPQYGAIDKSFSASQSSFTHYYTFTIGSGVVVNGITQDTPIGASPDVSLTSLTLMSLDHSTVFGADLSIPNDSYNTFSFSGLSAGSYALQVMGDVLPGMPGMNWAKYTLSLYTSAAPVVLSSSVASPAPEASAWAMAVVGLLGVSLLQRARKMRR